MKAGRLIIAAIGLAALVLAYRYGSVIFLALAVIAFVGGLYLMGANRKPVQKEEEKQNTKDKNQRK